MKKLKHKLWLAGSISLLLCLFVPTRPAAGQEHIFLITYGADSKSIEGDNDYQQEIVIRVPETVRDRLYLRIFDADVGGAWDAEFGFGKGFDSQTQFELYGAELLKSEIIAADKSKDNQWYAFARFEAKNGEHSDGCYIFRLRIKGLNGDDGNVFDVAVSQRPDENRPRKGVEILTYEPTLRLPRKKMSAEMRFFVPADVPEITVHDFDAAWGKIFVSTAFRSNIRVQSSGQDRWAATTIRLNPVESGRSCGLTLVGGEEIPNDATFAVSDNKNRHLPIYLPIAVPGRQNHFPVPEIRVTYLPDCWSVLFDASESRDADHDSLSFFWDFGDGHSGNGVRVTHRYGEQKSYEIRLIVSDDSGMVGNSTVRTENIHINRPPDARFSSGIEVRSPGSEVAFASHPVPLTPNLPMTASPGQEIAFDGSDSADEDGKLKAYFWDFDDHSTGDKKKMTHAFEKPGRYTVALRVEDDSDSPCNSDTDTQEVIINAEPVVKLGKDRIAAVGESLTFEAVEVKDTDGEILDYAWDMGDGTSKQGISVTHAYLRPGQYTVKLTVQDNSGTLNNKAYDEIIVRVNDPPVPEAGEDRRAAVRETVQFDASGSADPDGKIISYLWNFGDESSAEGEKVSHAYQLPGTCKVTLTVTDDSKTASASQSDSLNIIVNDPPVPEAGEDRRAAIGETLAFDGSESADPDGTIIAFLWDFGDSTQAEGAEASHAYSLAGTYKVTLTVTDDSGTSSAVQSDTMTVIVNHPPIADAGKDQRVTASAVQFDGSRSKDPDGKLIRYDWDFGDGAAGAGVSPVHVYGTSGTYAVKLTVTDDSGTLSQQSSDEMRVIVNHRPVADAGPDQIGIPGQSLSFDGSASFDPDGVLKDPVWDFGDGQSGSGLKVSHAWLSPGIYRVRLRVSDDTAHAEAKDSDECIVVVNARPVARIASDVPIRSRNREREVTAAPNQEIRFNAGSSYDPDGKGLEYLWMFRSPMSDAAETLTGQEVSKTYPLPGVYSVTLDVDDGSHAENDRDQDRVMIRINHQPEPRVHIMEGSEVRGSGSEEKTSHPEPLTPNPALATCERTLRFDGSASADPDGDKLRYLWDFGDGSPRKTGIRVIHTYKDSGTYPVILTVNDGRDVENSENTAAGTVMINKAPVADAGDDLKVCAGDTVLFSGGASHDPEGGLLKYRWDFGDGTGAEGLNPTRIFKKSGTYQITLTVEDDSGLKCNTASDQTVVRVIEAPVADAGRDMTVCANTQVLFDGSQSWDVDGVVNSFLWDFGDGVLGGGAKPTHIYAEPGIYPVKLVITGDPAGTCDDTNTAELSVTVKESPESSFTGPSVVSVGEVAAFDGSASKDIGGKIVSWYWDFGDGNSATGMTAEHAYRKSGQYAVKLTIKTDTVSECNTVTAENTVVVNAPPLAAAGEDKFVGTDEIVIFDGSGSSDPDGSIVSYEWNFGDGETASGVQARHLYRNGGQYPVTLKVTDDTGVKNNQAEDRLRVTVNSRPRAVIRMEKKSNDKKEKKPEKSEIGKVFAVCAGDKIYLSAKESSDPDGNLLKNKKAQYQWDLGDGQHGEGPETSHVFTVPGVYQVILTVDDGTGLANSRNESIETVIVNTPPVADAGPDQTVCADETVTFSASGSSDPDRNSLSYRWNFGDDSSADGETVTHNYKNAGHYQVRLLVTDDSGASCNSDEDTVSVKVNAAPIADAGPDREAFARGAHDAVLFDASLSSDPDRDPLNFHWDFGDGVQADGVQVYHTYIKAGTYLVRLRVRDGSGTSCGEATDEASVTVRER